MTCFRTKEGKTARSLCENMSQYTRFYRTMERGATVEEALEEAKKAQPRAARSTVLRKIQQLIENPDMRVNVIIYNRMFRKRCSVDAAIRWAARTGRVTIRNKRRKEVLQICKSS